MDKLAYPAVAAGQAATAGTQEREGQVLAEPAMEDQAAWAGQGVQVPTATGRRRSTTSRVMRAERAERAEQAEQAEQAATTARVAATVAMGAWAG